MGEPQDFNRGEIIYRIGTFFLLVAIGLLIFFFLSEAAASVNFNYFCWGLILLILSLIFRGRFRRSVSPSGRFSLVQRLMPKSKKSQEKKK